MTLADADPDAPLRPAELAGLLGVHKQSVLYWIKHGLLDPDGTRHKLPRAKVGGRFRVTLRDYRAWQAAVDGGPDPEARAVPTPTERQRTYEKTLAELRQMGVTC